MIDINEIKNQLGDFMAIHGDELILRGHGARMVLYSALVTALVANEMDLEICKEMPERAHLVEDWRRVANVLHELSNALIKDESAVQ